MVRNRLQRLERSLRMRRLLCAGGSVAGRRTSGAGNASLTLFGKPTSLPLTQATPSASLSTATRLMDRINFEPQKSGLDSKARRDKSTPPPTRRSGAIALKVGMLGVYDQWGRRYACTVLQLDAVQVVQVKKEATDGYTSVQLGAGEKKLKNASRPERGHLDRWIDGHGTAAPKRKLWEFRVTPDALMAPGTPVLAQHFVPGQLVDVVGTSKGKGFQGVMKRWNFKGQGASHGASLSHRSLGSTGQNTSPGRVFKGKKMPGRLGGERVTVQNLWLYKIDTERNLLYVKGHVPGPKGTYVRVSDAIKGAHFPVPPPVPTFVPEAGIAYPGEITAQLPEADPLIPPEGRDDE